MILLDTNVVSEPLRPQPNMDVVDWLNKQAIETLYLSTISIAELRFGIAVLPDGHKKQKLLHGLEQTILPLFAGRVLSFEEEAAVAYAALRASARAKGRAIALADGYIAAIAQAHKLVVATRDTAPFEAAEISVINPWTHG